MLIKWIIWRLSGVAAAVIMAEGSRHIKPAISDSTLSTTSGLGLEDLATFVSQNSTAAQHRLPPPQLGTSASSAAEHEFVQEVDESRSSQRSIETPAAADTPPSPFEVGTYEAVYDSGTHETEEYQPETNASPLGDKLESDQFVGATETLSPAPHIPEEAAVKEAVSSPLSIVTQSAPATGFSSNSHVPSLGPALEERSPAITDQGEGPGRHLAIDSEQNSAIGSERHPATGLDNEEKASVKAVISSLATLVVQSASAMALSKNLDAAPTGPVPADSRQLASSPTVADKGERSEHDLAVISEKDTEDSMQRATSSLATQIVQSATAIVLSGNLDAVSAYSGQGGRSPAFGDGEENSDQHSDIVLESGLREGYHVDALQSSRDDDGKGGEHQKVPTLPSPPTPSSESGVQRGEGSIRNNEEGRDAIETYSQHSSGQFDKGEERREKPGPSGGFEKGGGSTTSGASLDLNTNNIDDEVGSTASAASLDFSPIDTRDIEKDGAGGKEATEENDEHIPGYFDEERGSKPSVANLDSSITSTPPSPVALRSSSSESGLQQAAANSAYIDQETGSTTGADLKYFEVEGGNTRSAANVDNSAIGTHRSPLSVVPFDFKTKQVGDTGTPVMVPTDGSRTEAKAGEERLSLEEIPRDRVSVVGEDPPSVLAVASDDETAGGSMVATASVKEYYLGNTIDSGMPATASVETQGWDDNSNRGSDINTVGVGDAIQYHGRDSNNDASGAHVETDIAGGAQTYRPREIIDDSGEKLTPVPLSPWGAISKAGQAEVRTEGGTRNELPVRADSSTNEARHGLRTGTDGSSNGGRVELLIAMDGSSPGVIGLEGVNQTASAWLQHEVVGPAVATVARTGGAAEQLGLEKPNSTTTITSWNTEEDADSKRLLTEIDISSSSVVELEGVSQVVSAPVQREVLVPAVTPVSSAGGAATDLVPEKSTIIRSSSSSWNTDADEDGEHTLPGTDISSPGVVGLGGVNQAASAWVQRETIGPSPATVASVGGATSQGIPEKPISTSSDSSWHTQAEVESRQYATTESMQEKLIGSRNWNTEADADRENTPARTEIAGPGVVGLEGVNQVASAWVQQEVVGPAVAVVASTGMATALIAKGPTSSSSSSSSSSPNADADTGDKKDAETQLISEEPISSSSWCSETDGEEETAVALPRRPEDGNSSRGDEVGGEKITAETEKGVGHETLRPRADDSAWNMTGTETPWETQDVPPGEESRDGYRRFGPTHEPLPCGDNRTFHPARLYHLLWQRNRLRCPFSQCPIPDTVVFDSMGEAVDWFFTSRRESCIKRKLTSNTCLSNIFREFCKGSTGKGDPVAVLISWDANGGAGPDLTRSTSTTADADPTVSTTAGRDQGARSSRSGCLTEGAITPDLGSKAAAAAALAAAATSDTASMDGAGRRPTVAVVGHLTARQLHNFLFGECGVQADKVSAMEPNRPSREYTSTMEAKRPSREYKSAAELKRPATEHLYSRERLGGDMAAPTAIPRPHTQRRVDLGVTTALPAPHAHGVDKRNQILESDNGVGDAIFTQGYPRRSETAAKAAITGGGFCLLQKFVPPSGARNSTLRCQWTPAPPPSLHPSDHDGTRQGDWHDPGAGAPPSTTDDAGALACHNLQKSNPSEKGETRHWKDEGQPKPFCPNAPSNRSLRGERSEESSRQRSQEFSRVPERPIGGSARQSTPAFLRPSQSSLAEYGLAASFHRRSASSTSAIMTGRDLPWKGTPSDRAEPGSVQRMPPSEGVWAQCLLERCTNIFRAARGDLSCEDRCVTFEEPPPSDRMGQWPRSTREAVKSPALRQTVVEACDTIADHLCQVTKAKFRPRGLTAYFRQGQDGRSFLLFVSQWGDAPSSGVESWEPLLLRAPEAAAHSVLQPPSTQDKQRPHQAFVAARPLEPTRGEQGRSIQRRSSTAAHSGSDTTATFRSWEFSCPGCDSTGERRSVGHREATDNDRGQGVMQQDQAAKPTALVEDDVAETAGYYTDMPERSPPSHDAAVTAPAPSTPPTAAAAAAAAAAADITTDTTTSPTAAAAAATVNTTTATAATASAVTVATAATTTATGTTTTNNNNNTNTNTNITTTININTNATTTTITTTTPAFGKYYTSLGVVVDTCSWNRQRPVVSPDNGDLGMHADVGVSKCLRVLAQLHPGVSAERAAERCAEEPRLRLRGIRVCRECAVDISCASDARLRETDGIARARADELGKRLGMVSQQPRSKRQQEARLAEDIKAFQQRMNTSATLVQPHAVFKGGPDRDIGLHGEPDRGKAFTGGPTNRGVSSKRRLDRGVRLKGGPNRAASVATWRPTDFEPNHFPSRPVDSGVTPVKEGTRKERRPRPSTAGGESPNRRQMQNNSDGVPTENLRLCLKGGPNHRVSGVNMGRAADSGPREFPDPSVESGVTPDEEDVSKGRRPRPSTAGGVSSNRRQHYNHSSRRIVSAKAPTSAVWTGQGETPAAQMENREQGAGVGVLSLFGSSSKHRSRHALPGRGVFQQHDDSATYDENSPRNGPSGRLEDSDQDQLSDGVPQREISSQELGGRCIEGAVGRDGGEEEPGTGGPRGLCIESAADRSRGGEKKSVEASPEAASTVGDNGRRLKGVEFGEVATGGKGGSSSVSVKGRADHDAQRSTPRPRGQMIPAEPLKRGHSRTMTFRDDQDTTRNSPRRPQETSQSRQESQTRRSLGRLVVAAGGCRNFYARSEVALRRQELGSVYGGGGGGGGRSPSNINARNERHSRKVPAGKNQLDRGGSHQASRRRPRAHREGGENITSNTSPKISRSVVQRRDTRSSDPRSSRKAIHRGEKASSDASSPRISRNVLQRGKKIQAAPKPPALRNKRSIQAPTNRNGAPKPTALRTKSSIDRESTSYNVPHESALRNTSSIDSKHTPYAPDEKGPSNEEIHAIDPGDDDVGGANSANGERGLVADETNAAVGGSDLVGGEAGGGGSQGSVVGVYSLDSPFDSPSISEDSDGTQRSEDEARSLFMDEKEQFRLGSSGDVAKSVASLISSVVVETGHGRD